jgi:hypothetical protein
LVNARGLYTAANVRLLLLVRRETIMSHTVKLVVLAAATLALPATAAAQDPSTRTDLTVIGAVSSENVEYVADENATDAAELPIVYDDAPPADVEAETDTAGPSAADAGADLGDAVESE